MPPPGRSGGLSGRSLGSWRLSGVPLFYRHPGAATGLEPCCLCPERGAKRPGHQRPAAEPAETGRRRLRRGRRRGGGAEAESDSMGGHLIPSAAGWPQSRPPPPAVGGYSDRARPRQVSGRPALLTPATPPLPRPVGSGMPGLGLLKPSTPATGRAWVSRKERL